MPAPAGKTYAIHPALGVARLGNASFDPSDPTSYYLGPESPYEVPNQGKPYKAGGKIKKQAQRFRIYEFANGQAQREITLQQSDIESITWTVHLANRKAALNTDALPGTTSLPAAIPPGCFCPTQSGTRPDPHYWPAQSRNTDPTVVGPIADRTKLCLDPGPQSVGGATTRKDLSAQITMFPLNASPVSAAVGVGTLCTEAATGRLLVFAADGISQGVGADGKFGIPKMLDFDNNNLWYDDTADGPVTATITFKDGSSVTLDQPQQRAWVICASPRYTPYMNWLTTLWDVAMSYAPATTPAAGRPSFRNDIYPILRCAALVPWLTARGSVGHGPGRIGDYLTPSIMQLVSDNNPAPTSNAYKARNGVFARIRSPDFTPDVNTIQQFMPQVSNDLITEIGQHYYDTASVTPLQYARLQAWRDGNFDADGAPNPEFVPLESLPVAQQPTALDRGTLEMTAGTPFYPGIESWRIMRAPALYADGIPLRMATTTQPGDLTIGNSMPWQSDFLDCNDIWWPVSRPNEVTRNGVPMQEWVPDAWMVEDANGNEQFTEMVENWWQLGFVVTQDNGGTYEEVERGSV